jgi:protoporphyrinogen IX oxidase
VTPATVNRIARPVIALAIMAALVAALILFWPLRLYRWMLAIHIMAVISWMAGMFYLPRLFVYHCGAEIGSRQSETFKLMEWRLLTQIINPAMIATWAAGIWLIWAGDHIHAGWLQAKLVLVLLLSGFHGALTVYVRDFAADRNRHSERFYRIVNEVPTLLMIIIVSLAIVKPF